MKTIVVFYSRTGKIYLIPFNPELDVPEEDQETEAIESLIEYKGLSINDCSWFLVDELIFEIL